jgi:hypothetical protein
MQNHYERYEGYIPGNGNPHWGQSYYYNFYDPKSGVGALVRLGLLENQDEANTWFIVFKDGQPIFARTNQNLPYTPQRPADGISIAGMQIHAEIPLKRTTIRLTSDCFSAELAWDEFHPMADCIALSQDQEGSFAREMAHVHLEGTSRVRGHLVHRGELIEVDGMGFRDIGAGPRNWDALKYYRLAWPVFENGMAFAGIHGISTNGNSSYMRMFHDGERWCRVTQIDDRQTTGNDPFSPAGAEWAFVDEQDRRFEFTARPLFRWHFPLDTFVLCEQLMEYRLADGSVGYGLYETGYRLPWLGIDR